MGAPWAPTVAQPWAWLIALLVAVVGGGAVALGCDPSRAGSPEILALIGGTYAVLLVGTCLWLARRGELGRQLTPFRGDITIGALLAAGSYMVVMMGYTLLATEGVPPHPWILRLYLQVGDPVVTGGWQIGLAIMAIAAVEEVVWRGWVQGALSGAFGEGRGWLMASVLYGVAHLPTALMLGDPAAGPNPLLPLAAFGGGLVWGLLAWRFGRLAPSIFAHMILSWAIIEFPLLRL
ncbi:MAG: CPBP family intramembrane metalloprotease [Deltaproteobacteria bacterium]|nr:CPBP family intramembrane metalloprotease [Deltaproteobacteria bacterium]